MSSSPRLMSMARGNQQRSCRRDRRELTEPGLGKPKPQRHLIPGHLTGALEPVALVERDRAPVAPAGAGIEHLDAGSTTEVLDDQVERGSAEALPLVTLVNEELPQVVRLVVRTCDLVRDHHEPDWRIFGVDRPVQGASAGVFGGFE